jgi:hypothetical protein
MNIHRGLLAKVQFISTVEALIAMVITLSTRYGRKEFWFALAALPAITIYAALSISMWRNHSFRWKIASIALLYGSIYTILPLICFSMSQKDNLLIIGVISIVLASAITIIYAIRALATDVI